MNIAFAIVVIMLFLLGIATGESGATAIASSLANPSNNDGGDGLAPPQNTTNDTGIGMHQSDGSLTGSEITNNPSTWPGSDKIWNICAAIALAEGFNLGDGCAPYDLNNPGDLSPGDEAGQPTCGGAQQHGGSAIIVFCTAEGGWSALYKKISNIVKGNSSVYPASWTWQQVAAKYAGNSANWVKNVTNYLGVDPTSTPADYVNS